MNDVEMPAALSESPLGARLRLYLEQLRTGGRDLSDEQLAANWSLTNPRFSIYRKQFQEYQQQLGEFSVTSYESPRETFGTAILESAGGRRWLCNVAIDEMAPHPIIGASIFSSPPGIVVRNAEPADAAALRDLERQTPIVVGDVRVVYDRGADYFAGERLMGHVEMVVVENDGRIIGLSGTALTKVSINGAVQKGQYSHRLRLLPEAQGKGASGPLSAHMMQRGVFRQNAGYAGYSFVAEGNHAVLRKMEPGRVWPMGAARFVIDTASNAGEPTGRPADVSDSTRLVELFNRAHEREELFVPFSAESLATRLEREPGAYSWNDILIGERAALGVWDARLGVHREAAGIATDDVRALVLDYGCEPGAEDELVALVRAACARLSADGTSELSIFASPPTSCFASLSALAKRIEPYVVTCWFRPGEDLETRGVYVDQLYF